MMSLAGAAGPVQAPGVGVVSADILAGFELPRGHLGGLNVPAMDRALEAVDTVAPRAENRSANHSKGSSPVA